jgi:regulator of sirC expression with transglutaminase-like and TPR domain
MQLTPAAESFGRVIGAVDGIDLLRASVAVGLVAEPALDVEQIARDIENLAVDVRFEIGDVSGADTMIPGLHHALFVKRGFGGNRSHYYDPRNCYLHEVLTSRIGMPITLSILYIVIGRHLGMHVDGIGFPAHFVVRAGADASHYRFFDPFNEGQELSRADLAIYLKQQGGDPEKQLDLFLAAVTARQILSRLLTNLKNCYVNLSDYARAREIVNLMLVLAPWAIEERRDRGLLSSYIGDVATAHADLSLYLDLAPNAPDAPRVRDHLRAFRGAKR